VAVMCVVVTARCNVEVQSWSTGGNMPDCNVPSTKGKPGYVKLNGIKVLDKASCEVGIGGLHLVRIDALLCIAEETAHFGKHNNKKLRTYLSNNLSNHEVVAGMTVDEPMNALQTDAINALDDDLGVNIRDVHWRGSFAFVAQKSTSNMLVDKAKTPRKSSRNPAHLNVKIFGMSTNSPG